MRISDSLSALSESTRRSILMMLKNNRMAAGDIATELNISPAALSYHLKVLKKAELLVEYKYKNFVYYELNTTLLEDLIIWIKQFGGNENE